MDIIRISIAVAVFLLMLLCIKMYLDYHNRTNKNERSHAVRPEEEKPIIVTDDYIYKQSGLTKEAYEQRMALYEKGRKRRWEDSKKEEIKLPKKDRPIDDDLGMSF